jgi:lipoprotein-anchoring transpeptidase ErfK/SrfK
VRASSTSRLAAVAVVSLLLTSACQPFGGDDADERPGASSSATAGSSDVEGPAVTASVDDGATEVPVDTVVTAAAEGGTVESVRLSATVDGQRVDVPGTVSDGRWQADALLEPGTRYRLRTVATSPDGGRTTEARSFTTQALTLEQQTYPSIAPLDGETVGVGMPVVVTFDLPVKDRAAFERHMTVSVDGQDVPGSWHWYSDTTVHYRPKAYWPARSTIKVVLDVNGVPTGNGTYGQDSRTITFRTGAAVISRVDVQRHRLSYYVDGRKVRTFNVTTGDDRHRTRQGTKVIMEKFSSIDMDAATTGVDSADPDYYNIKGVRWAMRLTNSGEFIHAAPWSVGSQGRDNVSHGCTGMSMADSRWLFAHSRRGDVVQYVNSPRRLEPQNGWTDWNVDWASWQEGSAL